MARILTTLKILTFLSFIGFGGFSYAKTDKSVSLEDATTQVQKNSNGKILSAKTARNVNGSSSHRIKVLTPSGKIKVYKVPSGKPIDLSAKRKYRTQDRNQNYNQNSVPNNYRNPTVNSTRNSANTTRPSTTRQPSGDNQRK